MMSFAREAWPLVVPTFVLGLGGLFFGIRGNIGWLTICGAFLLLLAFTILLFFRDPLRKTPEDPRFIVSPADGVVVEATILPNGERFIAVFLSVFDVHVNRSPYSGIVTKVSRKPGTYLHANSTQGVKSNARIDVVLSTSYGDVRFSQLSGLVARKISCRVSEGDSLKAGERFGLIYFGSRMEVQLPVQVKLLVNPGDRVTAGETVIAAFLNSET